LADDFGKYGNLIKICSPEMAGLSVKVGWQSVDGELGDLGGARLLFGNSFDRGL